MMGLSLENGFGNPCTQGLNDCATLNNKTKHMALGIQFVDPNLDSNHDVCLSMQPIEDCKDATGQAHIKFNSG